MTVYFLLLAAAIGGDQLLKWWIVTHLEEGQTLPFLPGIIQLNHYHNTGAAWNSLSGKISFLVIFTAILMVWVVWLVVRYKVRHPMGLSGAALVLGGGIGNMIDRICRGYVVDMFDLVFMDYPIFNLADCFVVIGCILGGIYYMWIHDDGKKKKKEQHHEGETDGQQ